ncbi:MAG: hypothetical protein ACR2OZ_16335 [Verrucomicrobiales bacterium]
MTNPGIDVDSAAFVDGDNDGLYLVPGTGHTHSLTKTLIGWVKDDGIDTGASGGGSTIMTRCWFENCIHEACSNSGTGRVPEAHQCVMTNCGQGMECGYDGPQSLVDRCAIIACMVGARFGDNYDWDYNGHLTVRDSIILHSLFRYPTLGIYNDVWGMEWDSWTYREADMTIEDNYLTAPNAHHPDNFVWNPGADGPRLAPFMPVANSNVGVDLLVDQRQNFILNYQGTFDVRLSTFSAKPVSVHYSLIGKTSPDAASEATLMSGTVNFAPGETVKTISLAPPGLESFGFLRVGLDSPINAEMIGAPVFYYSSEGAPPDEVLISRSAAGWDYQALRAEPPNDVIGNTWKHLDYIETNWQQNKTAPIGFGTIGTSPNTIPLGTTLSAAEAGPPTDRTRAVYSRKAFTLARPTDVRALSIELLRDDSAVIYLNGAEVIRHNIDSGSVVGGTIGYSTFASENMNTAAEETERYNIPVSPALLDNLVDGTNVIAVEVHQFDVGSSDLVLDLKFTASFNPPGGGVFGVGAASGGHFLYWLDDSMVLETSEDLAQWTAHPEIQSPMPLRGEAPRRFFRLQP